jgi:hypothetical protein
MHTLHGHLYMISASLFEFESRFSDFLAAPLYFLLFFYFPLTCIMDVSEMYL